MLTVLGIIIGVGLFLNICEAIDNKPDEAPFCGRKPNGKYKLKCIDVGLGLVLAACLAGLLYLLYIVWYYVCCGFLVTMDDISLFERIFYFFLSMLGLGFVIGVVAIFFGWNPK